MLLKIGVEQCRDAALGIASATVRVEVVDAGPLATTPTHVTVVVMDLHLVGGRRFRGTH
jgi:hypothetical protein